MFDVFAAMRDRRVYFGESKLVFEFLYHLNLHVGFC